MATGGTDAVIIVGAGPTGLLLAAELGLAGVSCTVLERRSGPRDDSRAICLHARSMEALDLRGQAQSFVGAGLAVPSFPLGPRGAKIKFSVLDSDFPYMLDVPQHVIERLLLARATDLGVRVRWSSTVTAVTQDDSGVTVTLADGGTQRASFVVGCDGVRSFVRNAAAIEFPGIDNPGSVILADLRLSGLPMDAAYGDLSKNGMLLVFPFRDGTCRLVLYDYARGDAPVTEPVDLDEVVSSLRRVVGQDFGPRDLYWSRRYRSESRQARAYRQGRVLLAGDAAHAHSPAGAQGMNTGLQDAVNLGWKLAAELGGWGPDWLLDTYHTERHPVGADVLALSGRQFRLNTARTASRRALRWAVHRLVVPLPPVQGRLARDYSGLSIHYDPQPAIVQLAAARGTGASQRGAASGGEQRVHPMTGQRLPRGALTLADADGRGDDSGSARLYDLFQPGNFVLFQRSPGDAQGQPDLSALDLPDHVDLVRYRTCTPASLPAAILVRPDGHVAWASDDPDPAVRASAASAAARFWCGSKVLAV